MRSACAVIVSVVNVDDGEDWYLYQEKGVGDSTATGMINYSTAYDAVRLAVRLSALQMHNTASACMQNKSYRQSFGLWNRVQALVVSLQSAISALEAVKERHHNDMCGAMHWR